MDSNESILQQEEQNAPQDKPVEAVKPVETDVPVEAEQDGEELDVIPILREGFFMAAACYCSITFTHLYPKVALFFAIAFIYATVLMFKAKKSTNELVSMLNRSTAFMLYSFLLAGIIYWLCKYVTRSYIIQLVAGIPILLAALHYARTSDLIERTLDISGLFRAQFLGIIASVAWFFIDIFSSDMYRWGADPFALVIGFMWGLEFCGVRFHLTCLSGQEFKIPDKVRQEKPSQSPLMTRMVIVTVVLAVVAHLLVHSCRGFLDDVFSFVSIKWIFNHSFIGYFIALAVVIGYFFLYPHISRLVLKRNEEKDQYLHVQPYYPLLSCFLSGIMVFIALSDDGTSGVEFICLILIVSAVYTYFRTPDPAIRGRRACLSMLTAFVGIVGGFCVIPLILFFFIIFYLFGMSKAFLNEALSFNTIRFYHDGDLIYLNTSSMRDQNGNRWKVEGTIL